MNKKKTNWILTTLIQTSFSNSKVLIINNMSTQSNFLEFKWIPIFLELKNFDEIKLKNTNIQNLNASYYKNYDHILLVDNKNIKIIK